MLHLEPAGDGPKTEDQPTAVSRDAPSDAPCDAPGAAPSDAPEPEPTAATEDAAPEPAATALEEVSSPTEVTRAETEVVAEERAPPPAAAPVEGTASIDSESPLGEEETVHVEPAVELFEAEEPTAIKVGDAVVSEETEAEAVLDTGAATEVAAVGEEEEATPAGEWSILL